MSNEFFDTVARIKGSISRVPDRLSTVHGEETRAEFARIFGQCIISREDKECTYLLTLPFQAALLTDPILYAVGGGFIVLDHPTQSGQSEFAIDANIIDLNRKCSLYENRYPRMISCPRKGEKIEASWMANRLMNLEFKGPFAKDKL